MPTSTNKAGTGELSRYMHRGPASFHFEQRNARILKCFKRFETFQSVLLVYSFPQWHGYDRTDHFCPSSDKLARTPAAVPARAVSEEIQSPGFSKDADFWFADGTIVLVSQNVGFRVYKQGLAERSPLFSDLLSIPQSGLAGSSTLR